MVDKELLEAIGQMMDEKLDRKLQPIVDRLDKLEESSEEVRSKRPPGMGGRVWERN